MVARQGFLCVSLCMLASLIAQWWFSAVGQVVVVMATRCLVADADGGGIGMTLSFSAVPGATFGLP